MNAKLILVAGSEIGTKGQHWCFGQLLPTFCSYFRRGNKSQSDPDELYGYYHIWIMDDLTGLRRPTICEVRAAAAPASSGHGRPGIRWD